MDATTLLGTILARLLDAAAHLAASVSSWPSPARLVEGSLTAGSKVLLVAAVLAWVAGVLAVLVAVSDRGGAGAPAGGAPRPTPPLPPRRVRATVPEPAQEPVPVLVPVVAVQAPEQPTVATTAVPVAPVPVAVPVGVAVAVLAAAPEPGAAPAHQGHALPGAALPARSHGGVRTAAPGSRCRRCTQPRCWPSTGQRYPARVIGTSAPRACRTSLTAGTTHRCGAAEPWCGDERCDVPTRARPSLPGPGRAPVLPR